MNMKLRAAVVALLALLAVVIAPETQGAAVSGWASAYAPGVMAATVRYRLDNDVWRVPPPRNWYEAAGYIATNDCAQVGRMATLIDPSGRAWRVLVADCGGDEGPGLGADWMTRHGIVAELDWALWEKLTAAHGRPLRVELHHD